jgi:uncharacterized protein
MPGLRVSYPVVAITGPRQSGKTILAREAAADLPYVNLESPFERVEAIRDPMQFLGRFPDGAVLDEIQNAPELFSYLQVRVDADRRMGRWVITGSQQLELGRGMAQSLAGRVARLELLPFSYAELTGSERCPKTLAEAVWRGGYPRLYDSSVPEPAQWIENYLADFVDRDVRQILGVRDRHAFDRFLHLCAAHTGQIVNASALGQGCQVDHKTITAWLGVLEACYVIRLHRPHHRNFGKRIVKSPKLYFLDTGLVCRLLHITDIQQVMTHPNWGALVETWCMAEIIKSRVHRGLRADLWFWRSSDGIEVDAVIEVANQLVPIEIKASVTPSFQDAAAIRKLRELSERDASTMIAPGFVINGGDEARPLGDDRIVSWHGIAEAMAGVP